LVVIQHQLPQFPQCPNLWWEIDEQVACGVQRVELHKRVHGRWDLEQLVTVETEDQQRV
jgi:hypothetical protein